MREMPPQIVDKSKPWKMKYNLYRWIGSLGHIAIFMVYQAIAKGSEELG